MDVIEHHQFVALTGQVTAFSATALKAFAVSFSWCESAALSVG